MHDTGCLGLVHWDNPEGWNGEGGGRRVQDEFWVFIGRTDVEAETPILWPPDMKS